jgi:hypothetical protein
MTVGHDVRVGSVRPSQLMWAYGVGAMIDLPRLSVMVEGLDRWSTDHCRLISEDRLLAAVRSELGPQVNRLFEPPIPDEDPFGRDEMDPIHRIGVPVGVFPRWLRCPRCSLLSSCDSGVFKFEGSSRRPDQATYRHQGCSKRKKGKAPAVIPARFLVACQAGHLDDFPWREFVHRGPTSCKGTLRFYEKGSSLETANLFVACDNGLGFGADGDSDDAAHQGAGPGGCGMRPRSMVDAFGERAKGALPSCRGRHPHLRAASGDCGRPLRTILLGSSSSWFPKTISALSIPVGESEIDLAVDEKWELLAEVESAADVKAFRKANLLGPATKFSDDDLFEAAERRRGGGDGHVDTKDMKGPEWAVFSDPTAAPRGQDFEISDGEVPAGHSGRFAPTVLVEKIREVNALLGFTRLEAPEDLIRGDDEITYAPLSRVAPTWVPANEVRGEGILVRLDPDALADWESRPEVIDQLSALEEANRLWRIARRLPADVGYPGHRHVLLHSFSHLLMRELALECGYSSTSIRERIYASGPDDDTDMAGVLIYTAAPDSEGTLGGLVRLGEAEDLGRMISQAIEHARLCAADPLCSEHDPVPDRSLHAAACHACLFSPETACEFGNRFLDRATVVPTLQNDRVAFFN